MEVIKLNLIPAGALPVVHASQYDDGRDFKAELYEGVNIYTLDGTETLTAIVKKPDGNEVTAAVANTSDNYVIITTTEQMTACAGGNLGTLRIEKGAVTIATLNFILECQASPDTGIQSDSEIHNFEAQVNQMVEDALAIQYDSANVVFDNLPTEGHGVPYTVTSEGIGNAIDDALEMTDTASGAIATFESEYALPLRDLEIEINAVQESGTPTPSSPKAITGFTGANIYDKGINLWDEVVEEGYINSSGTPTSNVNSLRSKNFLPCTPNTAYYCYIPEDVIGGLAVCWYDANQTFISHDNQTHNVTSPANAFYFRLSLFNYKGTYPSYANNVGLNYPATDTAYHAYNANSTTTAITWNDEAGTVYGGSLDVTSGKLTVTHAIITLDGTETWTEHSSGKYFASVITNNSNLQSATGYLSNIYDFSGNGYSRSTDITTDNRFYLQGTYGRVWIYDSTITDLTALQSMLTNTPMVIVYPLATPVTYQLTPNSQISAIVGTNNVFTDTNGDTSLEYYAGHGAETAQVAEEIAADYTAKVVKTKNGIFAKLLKSPLNSVWLICCQKATTAGSGFVGIYSFDGVNLSPCVVYIDGMSASFDSASGTITVKYGGSTTDVYGSAFRLA